MRYNASYERVNVLRWRQGKCSSERTCSPRVWQTAKFRGGGKSRHETPYNSAAPRKPFISRGINLYERVIGRSRALPPECDPTVGSEGSRWNPRADWNCSRMKFSSFGNQALTNLEWKHGRPAELCPNRTDKARRSEKKNCRRSHPSFPPVARGISVINYEATFCRSHSGRRVDSSVPPQLTHALKKVPSSERRGARSLIAARVPLPLSIIYALWRRATWTMFNTVYSRNHTCNNDIIPVINYKVSFRWCLSNRRESISFIAY